MARWVDVIVGDYNYYFDGGAMLYALAQANGWKVSVLVDEAHNLVDARALDVLRRDSTASCCAPRAPSRRPLIKKALERVGRAWTNVDKGAAAPYQVLESMPAKLVDALQDASSTINEHLAAFPGPLDPDLQRFHFDALQFARLAESFGAAFAGATCRATPTARPARFDASASATWCRRRSSVRALPRRIRARCSPATLSPWHYYTDMLGLPANTAWVDVESPFTAEPAGRACRQAASRPATRRAPRRWRRSPN